MHRFFILFFLLLVTVAKAQLSDDFSDGDFTVNPSWQGNDSNFIVNSDHTLQLNAISAGSSFIATAINLNYSDTLEWRIRTKLAFAPSSSNYCRIYLTADTNDLQLPLNGYFLQLGEALSNDAIELFRQAGSVMVSVCRGSDGEIASAFDIQIRVLRLPTGEWLVYSDVNRTNNFSLIASGSDSGMSPTKFFAMECNYTSGNIHGFYFDDIYAGKFIPDNEVPQCLSLTTLTDSSIQLLFSEKLNLTTAISLSNYNIISVGNPFQLTIDSANDYRITLYFNQHFTPGNSYGLTIRDLQDQSGNIAVDTTIQFTFYPIGIGLEKDVIITEVYFELSSTSPLPNAEFVELYNRSDSAINLKNWSITDGSTSASFPDHLFLPGHYLVVYDGQNESLFSGIPNRLGLAGFPGLNNDTGDTLTIFNSQSNIIEKINFNDDSYHDSNKKNGGWTVERIDLDFTCPDADNWKASENSFHGTPGSVNSSNGIHIDNIAPWISNLYVVDSTHLEVEFSESIYSTIIAADFAAIDNNQSRNDCISLNQFSDKAYLLEFANSFSDGINQLRISDSISDCAGNRFDNFMLMKFGKTTPVQIGDVVINELLFNPQTDGYDFVEIYNCSSKIIDINNWIIQEADYDGESVIKDEALLSTNHKVIFPGDFLVFTRNPKSIIQSYYCPEPQSIFLLSDLPDYNSDEGRVVLRDDLGNRLDGFQYSEKMHFYLLNSPKGVSLERLNGYSGDLSNVQWHSAASTVGFATPGYKNSQGLNGDAAKSEIEISNEVFSPDNNGYDDLLSISYHFDKPGTILSLGVFTKEGFPVKSILENQTAASNGQIFWDGFTNDGKLALPGRYLIWAKTFNLDGESKIFRMTCVLAVAQN